MSKPISVALGACCLGYTALGAYARSESAVSRFSFEARRSAFAVIEAAERSQALFGSKAAAISQLRALAQECAISGWDGDSAEALNAFSINLAENLIRGLPEGLTLPEVAPEPDGSVSLDWIITRNRSFTISVGSSSRLAYAWLDGSDRGHGVAHFDGTNLPSRVLDGIRSIVDHAHSAIWAC
jgi:hypothetical protein